MSNLTKKTAKRAHISSLVGVCAGMIVFQQNAQAQAPPFGLSTQYSTGMNNNAVVLGDVNSDGAMDIVTCGNPIAILLGNGTGGFAPAYTVPADIFLSSLAIADLNNDGILDLVANNGSIHINAISVLIGLGGGTFAPPVKYSSSSHLQSIELTDLNADGNVDLVGGAGGQFYKRICVLLGDGTGAFGPYTNFTVPPVVASGSIAASDLNGDGNLDVAVATQSVPLTSNATVLLGNGLGSLTTPGVSYSFPGYTNGITVGDLNFDGRPDLATVCYQPNIVAVLLANVGGGFGAATTYAIAPPALNVAYSPKIADLNGDRNPDIAAVNFNSNDVSVLLGNGIGGFAVSVNFGCGTGPNWIVIGDVDASGTPDLVTANRTSQDVSVLLNQTATPVGIFPFGVGTQGCFGNLGISANKAPKVNTSDFALLCTNAPKNSLGLGIVTNTFDVIGSDPFGYGLKLHVDLILATEIVAFDFPSDSGRSAYGAAAIPNNPILAGQTFYAQGIWVEDDTNGLDCSQAQFKLVSSKGLVIFIQP